MDINLELDKYYIFTYQHSARVLKKMTFDSSQRAITILAT